MGRAVRETIGRLGGSMPEELSTPAESIHELTQVAQAQLPLAQEEE